MLSFLIPLLSYIFWNNKKNKSNKIFSYSNLFFWTTATYTFSKLQNNKPAFSVLFSPGSKEVNDSRMLHQGKLINLLLCSKYMLPACRKNFYSHSGVVVCPLPNSCKIPTAHYLEKVKKNRHAGNVITHRLRKPQQQKRDHLTCCRLMSAASIWLKHSWETTSWFLPETTGNRFCSDDSHMKDSTVAQKSNLESACRIQVWQTRLESLWRATSKAQRKKGVFLKRYTQGQRLNNSWK